MEMDDKYNEVLVKYLLNETNASEDQFIEEWVSASVNNRLHLEQLANTLNLESATEAVKKININQEWQHFLRLKEEREQSEIEGVTSNGEIFSINNSTGKSRIYRLLIAGAVAASVILVVLFGLGKFSSNKIGPNETVKNEDPSMNKTDATQELVLHEKNLTGKIKTISLPDGSHVDLYSNSEFTYQQPVNTNTREVILLGKANFKVAKDKTRPFMVFSGEIFTTALGTEFTVTARPNEKHILVRLIEGKVVVKSVKSRKGNRLKDTFLSPGQELVYDIASGNAIVRLFIEETDKTTSQAESISLPNNNNNISWFMFNNQSLSSIFDNLSKMYDVNIVYTKAEIKRMYFIGKFDKTDSVEFILKQIASINNLDVIKENNTFIIKKQLLKPSK